jgi:hypothetical protein
MNNDQILSKWCEHLAEKLQDRYGLPVEEAQARAHLWLHSIETQPIPTAQFEQGREWDYGIASARARSAAATRF